MVEELALYLLLWTSEAFMRGLRLTLGTGLDLRCSLREATIYPRGVVPFFRPYPLSPDYVDGIRDRRKRNRPRIGCEWRSLSWEASHAGE
jgi:hypothetical protein